ncbi:MAG: hypothetical protein JSW14_02700 [Candidatus Bathyarchaeum sp.]|nr:MAG: hypothetical protein JSW14_02700 [Candidatus Bathyarchaeum sp.]
MKKRFALPIVSLVIILGAALLISHPTLLISPHSENKNEETPEIYVGVTFCGDTTVEAKLLIDRVKDFTNLFVLYSGPISKNETAMTEISEYAMAAGLNIVAYFGDLDSRILPIKNLEWRLSWIEMAKQRWPDKFLGVHYYDEPGGIYIDLDWNETMLPRNMTFDELTYDAITNIFVRGFLRDDGFEALKANSLDAFVSDYALYWFDYLAGYDVVLAEAGWNHTLVQDIALLRGAARMQNKSWGEMITWRYRHPPYLDSGENIYEQMRTAYECGAEYFMVFNFPTLEGNEYGILLDEHFQALERFWNDVVKNPEVIHGSIEAEAALVLPKNYGWGMRHPDDRIWGWWGPDNKSDQIWTLSRQLLE